MASTTIYLGAPGSGKSTLMRQHVDYLRRNGSGSFFFIVDHDDSWIRDESGIRRAEFAEVPVYGSTAEWWSAPVPTAIFQGVEGPNVAQLAIEVGWSVYVDDECDSALDESWKDNPIREIVKRGRHLRNKAGKVTAVSALLATHRPSNLPSDIVGLFNRVYVGRLQSFNDADRVFREGWIPEARSAIEARMALESRAPGEFSTWPG